MYNANRYELECKYTQTVNFTSRPVFARLEMAPLAALLNQVETEGQEQVGAADGSAERLWGFVVGWGVGFAWGAAVGLTVGVCC